MSNTDHILTQQFNLVFLTNDVEQRTLYFYADRPIDDVIAACAPLVDLQIITGRDINPMSPQKFCESKFRPVQLAPEMVDAEFISMAGGVPTEGAVIELQLVDDTTFVASFGVIASVMASYFDIRDDADIILHRHYGDQQPHSLLWMKERGVVSEPDPEFDREFAELTDEYNNESQQRKS